MTKKIAYPKREDWTVEDLYHWKEGAIFHCAVPRDDIATQAGMSWKKFGLIGQGKTKKAAIEDWEKWIAASDFVADIF